MRSKAMERLERISRLFPHVEKENEKLRDLYRDAGFTPKYQGETQPVAKSAGTPAPRAPEPPPPPPPPPAHAENSVHNFSPIPEITRNLSPHPHLKHPLVT